jgi:hypothetical protein
MIREIQKQGGLVARGNRAFKSEKRGKELRRLKKQEEKRLRRLGKISAPDAEAQELTPDEAPAAPPSQDDPTRETS